MNAPLPNLQRLGPKLHSIESPTQRLARLVKVLGLRPLATLLGTDPSNLSKATSGTRDLSTAIGRRVLDLDHVFARALQIFEPEVVVDWLEGTEPTLGFARPIDILNLQGCVPLLNILDRIEAGGSA